MLKNYWVIAYRNFGRNKAFSLINILSLVLGISAALLIFLVVDYECSFDKFQKDRGQIYRVVTNSIASGRTFTNSGVVAPMGDALRKEMAGLDAVIPFRTWSEGAKLTIPTASGVSPIVFKHQQKIAFVDETYFDLLQYRWLAGSITSALLHPYNVVLTTASASLYFPGLSPGAVIDREIYYNDSIRMTVTGVVKDLANNTDFTFNTFISRKTLETAALRPYDWNDWNSTDVSSQLLIKLSPGATKAQMSSRLNQLLDKYHAPDPGSNVRNTLVLQPLSDLHFNSSYDNFGQRVAHKPTLYGLLAIAAFLLILGCINFVNLTTAKASRRAKEIGVRKTMGSSRRQLLPQFLSETFFLTLIATLLSVIILPLIMKAFAGFIPQGLHVGSIFQPQVLLFLFLLILVITVLSGAYPAFVLSSFNPVTALSGRGYPGKAGSGWLRKTLTVCQFVIAQVFIIATIVVSKQISFSLNQDLGFKKDAILYFHTPFTDANTNNRFILADRLKAIPGISMVSLSNNPPSARSNRNSMMKYVNGEREIESNVEVKFADTNYIGLYGISLLAGANLPYSDTLNSLLINETYAHILGFHEPEQALGKLIEWDKRKRPVIGVVADFHQRSFHEPILPAVIASSGEQEIYLNVALENTNGASWRNAIGNIGKAWKALYPEDDFEYAFLDDTIAAYYQQEQDIYRLLSWATGLSIFISYLGLMGLVLYITAQRTKEIGIRKIAGASVFQIILLLLEEFLTLVVIAAIIAIPISWWSTNNWLQNFAYRTGISWWIFVADILIVMVITLLTLGAHTFKAANADPVRSIRNE